MNTDFIFDITSEDDFNEKAFKIFHYQYKNNTIYKQFCDLLKKNPKNISSLNKIPFLPIEFFKNKSIFCGETIPKTYFSSSGTTGMVTSKHFVKDISIYEQSFRLGFEYFYGNPKEYIILALLPSYLERTGSSLIYMVEDLIQLSDNEHSGFYLYKQYELAEKLTFLDQSGKKILIIGVSFALLDLVEKYSFSLKYTIIIDTGGMKGRRKELIREELHSILKKGFGVDYIHSEYGMTELLSQGYSAGDGIFNSVPWLKILTRDPEDALTIYPKEKSGGINIIDLANIYSCSFIATQDLGKIHTDGTFEVLGRFDNADIRGCNLLIIKE